MSALQQTLYVVRKDLLLGWRGRTRTLAVALFGMVALVLFSFAVAADGEVGVSAAAGFLIVALLLSSILSLEESFRLEAEDRALEGLLLLPVDPVAIYYGKAIANTILLILLGPILLPLTAIFFSLELDGANVLGLILLWLLASAGIAAPGTLYASMTSRVTGRDVILPLLLFPLTLPILMTGVRSFDLILRGDAMSQLKGWILLLSAFDLIYWILCGVLFSRTLEE
ncbi:MAG: transcriptional regulator [bacterium]|nr:transcriptional regulator [bacterium]